MKYTKSLLALSIAILSGCDSTDTASEKSDSKKNNESVDQQDVLLGSGEGDQFTEGDLELQISALSAGGTTTVTTTIVDTDTKALITDSDVVVEFASECADESMSTITQRVETSTGVATAIYQDNGCGTEKSSDRITATLIGSSPLTTAIGEVTLSTVLNPVVELSSVYPEVISTSGQTASNLPSQASVRFVVLDSDGSPITNEPVSFELSTDAGGILLSEDSVVTDDNGIAQIFVISGTKTTSVRVIATVDTGDGNSISTSSSEISIQTGFPDQNYFSLEASSLNPSAWEDEDASVELTASAADFLGNATPDGTLISFIAESGDIDESCRTTNGQCSVVWRNKFPHPDNGVESVLAYARGTASFVDSNNNGQFDADEQYTSLSEAYLDENENRVYDFGESIADFNNNLVMDEAPNLYQGVVCTTEAKQFGHCTDQVDVRSSVWFVLSSADIAEISVLGSLGNAETEFALGDTHFVFIADTNGNTPPAGTSISVTTDNGVITTGESGQVLNQSSTFGYFHEFSSVADSVASSGTLTVTVQAPDGEPFSQSFVVTD